MSASHRPRQVTFAAVLIMAGSALLVLTVWERISGLHTLESQQSVQKFLSEPPGDSLGLGVEGVLGILRVVGMVAAACGTAAAILGYQVLQRSKSARIALSVLAVPIFVTGLVTGGLVSSVVAAAAAMLWFPPARDWFDGRESVSRLTGGQPDPTASQAPPTTPPSAPPTTPSAPPADPPTSAAQPRAVQGFGVPPAGEPTMLPALAADRTARPSAVTWACLMTWVCAGLAIALMAASAAVLATSPGLVFDELHRQNPELASQGVSDDALRVTTFVLIGAGVLWSVVAIVVAALVWRGVTWARTALIVSASASGVVLLVATLGQPLMLLPLAASVVTLALLVRPDVKAWFAGGPTR